PHAWPARRRPVLKDPSEVFRREVGVTYSGAFQRGTHMKVTGKVVAVTGGARGIGRALARRFAQEGARHVAVADLDDAGVQAIAAELHGSSMRVDVSRESDVAAFIDTTERNHGPIELFCSNAGIGIGRGLDTPNDVWQKIWEVNLMAHVYAARHLVPRMI